MTWQILHERGTACLRFAVAIAVEAGLRIGEICNLRLNDVNLSRQTVFVRLPNKTKREREALFSHETKRYFIEWMAERNPLCTHDHVLHNNFCNRIGGRLVSRI
jgi:integrase/recombinase XerC